MIRDIELRNNLAARARERISAFSIARYISGYESIIKAALNIHKG